MKDFYLMCEPLHRVDCPGSLMDCPLIRTAYHAGFDYRLKTSQEKKEIYIESFRYPVTPELKNNLIQMCRDCARHQK